MTVTTIQTYGTQAVRDLAWACFSQPLLHIETIAVQTETAPVTSCALELTPTRQRWLAQLDDDPAPLLAHIELNSSKRLGLYFEALWHFFLTQDADVDLVAHNLPVRDQGRTLGEFDCIYYCRQRRQHVHLELAVKYYLGFAAQAGTANEQVLWYGPKNHDRLDLKLSHMLERQIRLGESPAARPLLDALHVDGLLREIALRGYLFQPSPALSAPAGFNAQSCGEKRFGQWVKRSELADFVTTVNAESYFILPRLRWLSPALAQDSDKVQRGGDLVQTIAEKPQIDFRPRLVAALDTQGREILRFFIVPNAWPGI